MNDDGKFQADINGLSKDETYFYRTFASNNGGFSWAPETFEFKAEERVSYETGKLFINTTLGTWEHSNGDTRTGDVSQRTYYDNQGNSFPSKFVLSISINSACLEIWKLLFLEVLL